MNALAAILLGAAAALLGAGGPNAGLAALSGVALAAGVAALARTARLPVLVAAFALPWLQASISIYHANWLGIDVARYFELGGEMETAVALSLIGVAAMALGLRLGAGKPGREIDAAAYAAARATPERRWFAAYCGAGLATLALPPVVAAAPGLYQLAIALFNLKWAFFFALAYACAARGRPASLFFVAAFLFELALGLGGFFSDFKTVFVVAGLAFAAAARRVAAGAVAFAVAAVVALALLGSVWSAVKDDYRATINGGSGLQSVEVDYPTRLGLLAARVGALDGDGLAAGFEAMLRRLSYVEYFALELRYVPAVAPFADGAIAADAIARPFAPRLLFPDKPEIDDGARMASLTGLERPSAGTSISIGYIGEFYADFGVPGLFGALLAMGAVYGLAFRWLTRSPRLAGPLGMGLACETLTTLGQLDNSFTKAFGGFVASLLACWCLGRFVPSRLGWMLAR